MFLKGIGTRYTKVLWQRLPRGFVGKENSDFIIILSILFKDVTACIFRQPILIAGRLFIHKVLKTRIWGAPRPALAVGSYSSGPPAGGNSPNSCLQNLANDDPPRSVHKSVKKAFPTNLNVSSPNKWGLYVLSAICHDYMNMLILLVLHVRMKQRKFLFFVVFRLSLPKALPPLREIGKTDDSVQHNKIDWCQLRLSFRHACQGGEYCSGIVARGTFPHYIRCSRTLLMYRVQTGDMKRRPGNGIEGAMVCTSLGSLLRPLFYFLDDVSYPQSLLECQSRLYCDFPSAVRIFLSYYSDMKEDEC